MLAEPAHTVEHIMSPINLGCQCVGLMREEGPAVWSSHKECKQPLPATKNALHFKDEVKATLNQPIDLLSDILQSLTLKGKNFKTFESCDNGDIDAFREILLQLAGSLTIEDVVRLGITAYALRSVVLIVCKISQPVSLQLDVFSKLRFLPDPMICQTLNIIYHLMKQCKSRYEKKIAHLYKNRRKDNFIFSKCTTCEKCKWDGTVWRLLIMETPVFTEKSDKYTTKNFRSYSWYFIFLWRIIWRHWIFWWFRVCVYSGSQLWWSSRKAVLFCWIWCRLLLLCVRRCYQWSTTRCVSIV